MEKSNEESASKEKIKKEDHPSSSKHAVDQGERVTKKRSDSRCSCQTALSGSTSSQDSRKCDNIARYGTKNGENNFSPSTPKRRGMKQGKIVKKKKKSNKRTFRSFGRKRADTRRKISMCTIFTTKSHSSSIKSYLCKRCGHHCFRSFVNPTHDISVDIANVLALAALLFDRKLRGKLRFSHTTKLRKCPKKQLRPKRRRLKKTRLIKYKTKGRKVKKRAKPQRYLVARRQISEMIQVGSCSCMFSPLCIQAHTLQHGRQRGVGRDTVSHEISLPMIRSTIKYLSKWFAAVKTEAILKHLKRNFPINPNNPNLLEELRKKLNIAAVLGSVVQVSPDTWSLPTALDERSLSDTHVTKFWKIYRDMGPVKKKDEEINKENPTKNDTVQKTKHLNRRTFSYDYELI